MNPGGTSTQRQALPRILLLPLAILCLSLLPASRASGQDGPRDRAQAHLARGEFQKAVEEADRALEGDPEDPVAMRIKAEALSGLRRWDEAVELFHAALERFLPGLGLEQETSHALARTLLAQAKDQFESGRPLEAEQTVNDALVWNVDFVEGILFRSRVLTALGRREDAWFEIETALEKAPDHPDALLEAARFHVRSYEYTKALPYFDRILDGTTPPASEASRFWAFLTAGKIRLERGERGLAWKFLREAARLDPDDEEARSLFDDLERLRVETRTVARAERRLLIGCISALAFYLLAGAFAWRALARRGVL
jgi:tetratricopeptide (TPR) repeat protein